ncbi:GL11066 [Drosophila persimilis]|uniref:Synaptosomal-associated protein 29 n=2 Tax=pseudoobscura subgroup TaxID=32358 RepID=A0A6I8ULN2_DROPS|nr:synaptosomal-associated protein 29 [Drosophila pseudoobscura]XP_002015408.1 synaptosomal-associated protein 29 [Drosophila persimilis]XP_017148192.1 synaptosomal-associated protein 29 [Drosophila miranda]EDW31298.1 GL11066 [Drosophila persimilis]
MANNYLQPVHNYFDDVDRFEDVDDDLFLKNKRTSASSHKPQQRSTNPFENDDDEDSTTSSISAQRQAYAEKRRAIEQRTLDSTEKSLGLLYETEEVGKATAIELAKQREQLEKTSHQLDEINSTLRFSQRHLNGLKSVFGGLKNYLSGNRDQPTSATASPTASQSSQEANSNVNAGVFGGSSAPMSPSEPYDNHPVSRIRGESSSKYQPTTQAGNPFQAQLDSNLEDMCDNLSRLKFLATDLGTEIESQNELLDNMNYKIEDVDLKMTRQNKDMNKLLKK